jgi:hypothetical protein
VDRHWNLLAANQTVQRLLTGVAPAMIEPPINVLRIRIHPDGLAPHVVNLGEWRVQVLDRLRRQAEATADPALADLLKGLRGYPIPAGPTTPVRSKKSNHLPRRENILVTVADRRKNDVHERDTALDLWGVRRVDHSWLKSGPQAAIIRSAVGVSSVRLPAGSRSSASHPTARGAELLRHYRHEICPV